MSSMKSIDQVLEMSYRIQTLKRKMRELEAIDTPAPQMIAQLKEMIARLETAIAVEAV